MDILPSVETLRQLFANNNKFRIPRFQRDYKWKFNEQIQEFWDDLFSSFQNNNKHFLGTLVLSKSDDEVSDVDEFYVVDGQQRLTTMMLLYHVIYSIACRFIEEPKSRIFNNLIENTNNTNSAEDLKSFCSSLLWDGVKDDKYLTLNEKDNADYIEILDHGLLLENLVQIKIDLPITLGVMGKNG